MAEKTDQRELAQLKKQLAERQLKLATHQAKHEQTLKVQSALYRIAEAASTVQDMQEFYAAMHRIVDELMYARNCYIATYDEQTNLVSFPYWVDLAGDEKPPPEPLGQRKSATQWVIQHGEVLDDASGKAAEVIRRGGMEIMGTPSVGIAAPLNACGKTLGVILVQSYEPGIAYTVEDAELLSFVAQHIAVALTRARAIEITHQRNAELEIINSVQHGLVAQLDIQAIYDLVGDKVREIFDAQVVMISTYDQQNRVSNLVYLIEKGERFYLQTGPLGPTAQYLIETRKTILMNSAAEMQAFGMQTVPGTNEVKSGVWVPLVAGSEVTGSISLQNIDREHAFSDSDVRLLETIANSMSVALENALLFDEVQKRNQEISEALEQQTAMSEVLRALSGFQPDLRSLLEIIAVNAAKVCGADDAHIYRIENETLKEWTHRGPIPGLEAGESLPLNRDSVIGRAIVDREIIHIRDAAVELDESEYPVSTHLQRRWGYRTVLATPLLRDGEPIGGIAIRRKEVQPFTEKQIELIKIFANQAVIAIENARLFDETQRLLKDTQQRNAELAIINSVQEGLASKLDYETIIDLVGDKIRDIFDAQSVAIGRYDHVTGLVHYNYVVQKGQRIIMEPAPFAGMSMQMINTRRTLVINENVAQRVQEIGAIFPSDFDLPRSTVYVPLLVGETVTGVINVANLDREGAFSESDVRLLQTLANSLSVALENARLFDETQRLLKETEQRAAELAIINSVQQGLAAQLDFQAIIDLVGDKIREVFQADTTYICLYDPQEQLLHFPYYSERGYRHHHQMKLGEGLTSYIITSRQPLLLNTDSDLSAYNIVYQQSPDATQDLNKTFLGVPFFTGNEVRGVISVQNYRQNAYSESDMRLLTTVAASMGVALENARLFAETQQRAAELATVNTVSQALAAETELEALIHLTGEQVRKTFNADIAYVALLDQQTNLIHFPYVFGEEFTTLKLGEGLTSKIIETAEPLLINRDMESRRAALGTTLVGKQSRSYLGVPIIAGKQAIGAISMQNVEEEGRFTESDVRLLSTIAANVGSAIRNASLFDQVKRQKQYYETIIANSPAAIVLLDMDVDVTGWNPAAERLFGYTAKEALGRNIDELVANREDIYEEAARFSAQGKRENQIRSITRRIRKDGTLVDVEIMALPVIVDSVQTGFITIYHDITELQHARQQAIEANQAKSAFLANMSHELRTPLNAILGFTRIVRRKGEGVLPEKQLDNLDKVLVSAEHLLGLINTVLDIAKIEAGRMDVQISSIEVKPLIDLAMATTQPLVRQGRVRLVTDVADNLPRIYSDQEKLKQILLNLLSNAAKFTHEGRITISARQANELLVVSVADTGIGVSSESLKHIFEEFQQADSSTTRQYGGTGLGLSISRSLARLLGGDLIAESQQGLGSTFTLTIPLQYPEMSAEQPEDLLSTTQPPPEAGDRPLVLVIDDHPDAVALLRENLEEAGYRVAAALSGEEGLRLADKLQPFAITLDIMMPNKDGWQVLHDLKANPATRRLPVIMISIVDKKALGFRLGAADYLVKPLDEKEVLASLARLAQASGTGVPRRVLVVDDDPAVIDMVSQLLENSHTIVESAFDGHQALEVIHTSPPDVILLDLLMPRMDGFKVIEKLQERPGTSQIPIIVLTAKSLSEAEAEMLQSSVAGIVQKRGLQGEVLLRQIEEALQQAAMTT